MTAEARLLSELSSGKRLFEIWRTGKENRFVLRESDGKTEIREVSATLVYRLDSKIKVFRSSGYGEWEWRAIQ